MTGPEHYRAAEEEFVWSASFMKEGDFSAADRSLVRAQVHATLALAAATALQPPNVDLMAWADVASMAGKIKP